MSLECIITIFSLFFLRGAYPEAAWSNFAHIVFLSPLKTVLSRSNIMMYGLTMMYHKKHFFSIYNMPFSHSLHVKFKSLNYLQKALFNTKLSNFFRGGGGWPRTLLVKICSLRLQFKILLSGQILGPPPPPPKPKKLDPLLSYFTKYK